MTPSLATLLRRAAPVIGAGIALVLCGCMTPYELREFHVTSAKETWGEMYVGLQSHGHWKEGGLNVEGTPYGITFSPRVKEAPPPDCAFHIANLRITAQDGEPPVFAAPRLDLTAGIAKPNEPNWRPHSAYFFFVPLSQFYLTTGGFKDVDLPYRPLRARFDLVGGPGCAAAFAAPIPYDFELKPHVWKGESSPWPSV